MAICVVIGASGAIGSAITEQLAQTKENKVIALSRSNQAFDKPNITNDYLDITDENSIKEAASHINESIDAVFITTGLLSDDGIKPEKSIKQIEQQQMRHLFDINSIGPMLIAKHFLPLMNRKTRTTFAAISARVSSISDNRLGGWYSYRGSKAALNMLLKTLSIECQRNIKNLIVIGLHPGTVDSPLSKPFQRYVPAKQLFNPDYSASLLLNVVSRVTPEDSGKLFAYDGQEIWP